MHGFWTWQSQEHLLWVSTEFMSQVLAERVRLGVHVVAADLNHSATQHRGVLCFRQFSEMRDGPVFSEHQAEIIEAPTLAGPDVNLVIVVDT